MKQILDDIINDICLTENDFKLKQETIRGVNYKCFDSKILNLNDYFKLSLLNKRIKKIKLPFIHGQ